MNEEFKILIIGAGNIGAFFDTPASDKILTHAHAFTKTEGFKLMGFFDVDFEKAQQAARLWNVNAYKSIEEAFGEGIDVACVAVPDNYHYAVLKELSKYPLKLIFAEKPLTKTIEEAEEIIELYKNTDTKIAVNYIRRYLPELEKIKNDIDNGLYGRFISGNCYYGKGILHNGSHPVDLLRFMLGDIEDKSLINFDYDFYDDDPSVSAVFFVKNKKPFIFQNIDCNKYTVFEMDFLFEAKRIRIVDLGYKVEEYDVIDSPIYKGYKNIIKTNEISTSLADSMRYAALNIYENLTVGKPLLCNVYDAYAAMKTCIDLKEKAK